MKKFYFLFSIFFFSICSAQIVNIPDANLKTKLLSSNSSNYIAQTSAGSSLKIDTNNNGEIEISEVINVNKLELESSSISNTTGLNYFSNLKSLNISDNNLTSFNTTIPLLNNLQISGNQLTSIDINSLTSLISLQISNNNISSLSIVNGSLQYITTGGNNLANINLQGTPSLKKLYADYSQNLQVINGLNMPNLDYVQIVGAPSLTQLNFTGSTVLNKILMQQSSINTLDLTNLTGLQTLQFENNTIPNVILNGCTSLSFAVLKNCGISTISLNNTNSLSTLNLSTNNLTTLNLTNNYALTYLECKYNQLTTINLSNSPNIQNLYLSGNQLNTIDLSNTTAVHTLLLANNLLNNLNVSMLTSLQSIDCKNNLFSTLDFSNNKVLYSVDCAYNNNLTSVFLKNGTSQAVNGTNLFPNPALLYVCCDNFEIDYFNASNNAYNNNITNINSYCSFTPGGSFYTIQGNTKYDINNNGCDVSDPKKAFQKFNITNGIVSGSVISNIVGEYSIPVQAGSHTVTPILENPTYFNISPASITANFPTQTSPLNQNFCLSANGNHNDLEIVIIPITAASPGFSSKYKILYKNKGTTAQSGNFTFNYDDNLMNYLNASIAPTSQSFGILNYDFVNLLPFEVGEITVNFTLNTPTATPPLVGGQILNYTAQINGLTDETPLDNTFTLNQTVVNSFDPNDKTCLEGNEITQTKVGDYVHYLIRFENTGTANAQNIVVKDIIDTTKFDINSLVAMSGSHSLVTRITNPNTVEFIFEGIQLPYNDLYNDGYVSFKIKTKSTLVLGDSFSNTANIYFDYNAPIVTNTATTNVANILGTSEISAEKHQMEFYPNPVENVINFKGKESVIKIEIYDASGRIVLSKGVKNNETNISELRTGNYFVKIYTKKSISKQKIIKK